ncbi:3-hydroxyacyl-CoA dehydrogenase [Streptomyces sp. MnatMP-M27]|nr:3-hydroxyacyl-CoA dehydrogenase [Streptomyces sp. MnatMP-M27]
MTVVSTRTIDDIVVVVVDNPPVNMGNRILRQELADTLRPLAGRTDIAGIVLASGGKHFYSGSDIREFDGEIAAPSLPEVIDLLENLDVPVVAALNGFTLGGGLELALACDVRIAEPQARFGLPETTLGVLPGAGGTVRLPRLVGLAAAIDMIASGSPITTDEALRIGLIDAVVDPELFLKEAVRRAGIAHKRRVLSSPAPASDPAAVEEALTRAARHGRARPNVTRAVALLQRGVGLVPEEALAEERRAFDELRRSAEARNLRYLFFAKRAAAKALSTGAEPRTVTTVGIGGAGTMGAAIATACSRAGMPVVLFDVNAQALDRAAAALPGSKGKHRQWVTLTREIADLGGCDLVIDAVFEDFVVKTEFLTAAEAVLAPDAVLASNTSYLNLDLLAQPLARPECFAGLHFFNPADRNPLVEVVRTRSTDDQSAETLALMVRRLKKAGIAARVGEGFVANRVYADYRGQAEILVEDGASPADVDAAMVALGLAIGPFAVGDMSGLDIAWARRKRLAASRDSRQRYVTIPDTLCEAGRLGRKTGAGWYRYPEGASRGVPDPEVDRIIDEARAAKGIVPRLVAAEEIQQRILCAMLVAGTAVLDDGIARHASDIDVALTEGFAFPTWLGGPMRHCSQQPQPWLIHGLRAVYESDPVGYQVAEPAARGRIPDPVQSLLAAVTS